MKKILTLGLGAIALLAAAGCTRNNVQYSETETSYRVSFGTGIDYVYVNVWVDPVTKCEHFVTDDGFMTPRLTAEGVQRCGA